MITESVLQNTIVLVILFISTVAAVSDRKCSIADLTNIGCSETETCIVGEDAVNGVCRCKNPDYNFIENKCIKAASQEEVIEEDSHVFAFISWSCIFISIVIVGVYLCYKYRVINWLKYKINQRYILNNDDVMIGQDDE